MSSFSPPRYNAPIESLIASADLNQLGPGKADRSRRATLAGLSPEAVVAPQAVRDVAMAESCLAGLWLLYDFLDESHTISQSLDTLVKGVAGMASCTAVSPTTRMPSTGFAACRLIRFMLNLPSERASWPPRPT